MKNNIKPYEIICPECNGDGFIRKELIYNSTIKTCPKCKGKKIIDWIENIVGVKGYYGSQIGELQFNTLYSNIYIYTKKGWEKINK